MTTQDYPTILFNYLPPGLIKMPSPAFSVLKSYLRKNDIDAKVAYWNMQLVDLQLSFLWASDISILESEELNLLIFFNYISIHSGDMKSQLHIKSKLMRLKPHFIGYENDFFENHMKEYSDRLDDVLDNLIADICSNDISFYGFSASLYQWLPASIISAKIKNKYPNARYLIGGIGTYKTAVKILEYFPQFDCALWGEGENALTDVIRAYISNSISGLSSIPNIAYRTPLGIQKSNNSKVLFVNLSDSPIPDYSDYFTQIGVTWFNNIINKEIPIEGGRGCHWNRCHFCFLNSGYKNRIKSVDAIEDEIVKQVTRYNCNTVSFLDNDIINNDRNHFEQLLKSLWNIKQSIPEFKISLAEIITKGITSALIKKMALVGFDSVQIGYESPSDSLLAKIQKKNSFASNLLFIKFALIYGIKIAGANIIMGLIEECDADILEASENLYYLRFFLSQNKFKHSQSYLAVSSSSKYVRNKDTRFDEWKRSFIFAHYLPDKYCDNDPSYDIIDALPGSFNLLWNDFFSIERYYIENNISYKLLSCNEVIIYQEYFNGNMIKEIEFERRSLEWTILELSNNCVTTISDLTLSIKRLNSFEQTNIETQIINAVKQLTTEGLLYSQKCGNECVSIIDTSIIH